MTTEMEEAGYLLTCPRIANSDLMQTYFFSFLFGALRVKVEHIERQ